MPSQRKTPRTLIKEIAAEPAMAAYFRRFGADWQERMAETTEAQVRAHMEAARGAATERGQQIAPRLAADPDPEDIDAPKASEDLELDAGGREADDGEPERKGRDRRSGATAHERDRSRGRRRMGVTPAKGRRRRVWLGLSPAVAFAARA
jgi:hypothetical protein